MERVLYVRFDNNNYRNYYYDGEDGVFANSSSDSKKLQHDFTNTGMFTVLCDIESLINNGYSVESFRFYDESDYDIFMEEVEYFPIVKKALEKMHCVKYSFSKIYIK